MMGFVFDNQNWRNAVTYINLNFPGQNVAILFMFPNFLWLFTITVDKENISILTSRRRVWTGQFLAVSEQILGPHASRKRQISILGILKTIMSWWRHNLEYLCVDRLRG